jgi:hypothetical protein
MSGSGGVANVIGARVPYKGARAPITLAPFDGGLLLTAILVYFFPFLNFGILKTFENAPDLTHCPNFQTSA